MKQRKATMRDIAEKCGVSKATVSYAFSAPHKITRETYEMVMKAARELDYLPDPTARNFSLGRHYVIGFLLPQHLSVNLSNPHMQGIIKGVGTVCEENGYSLNIIPPLRSSLAEAVKSAMVDGFITIGIPIDLGIQDVLRQRHMPIVVIDGEEDPELTSVNVNNRAAARLQIGRALEKGHRSFVFVYFGQNIYSDRPAKINSTTREKFIGYSQALSEYGLDFASMPKIECETTFESGVRCADRIIDEGLLSSTCVIVLADIVAMGMIQRLRERGVKVPQDISVIGFDGIESDLGLAETLTTVRHSAVDKGSFAAKLLFELISSDKRDSTTCYIDYSFTEGLTLTEV